MQPSKRRSDSDAPRDRLASLKAAVEESRDGVILFAATGAVLHKNAAASSLLSQSSARDAVDQMLRALRDNPPENGDRRHSRVNGFAVSASLLPPLDLATERIGILTIWCASRLPTAVELREHFGFTARESDVARLLAERRTDAEIGAILGISWHTVRSHIERIFAVLEVHSRRDAAERLRSW